MPINFSSIFDIFNKGGQSDQNSDIDTSEVSTSSNLSGTPNAFPESRSLGCGNALGSDSVRFGDSANIQQCELELRLAKDRVDADRRLISAEQAQADSARSRMNQLSDQANHEPNDNLARSYREQMIGAQAELEAHQRKLEQARADLAIHQQAEYDAEDKLRRAKEV